MGTLDRIPQPEVTPPTPQAPPTVTKPNGLPQLNLPSQPSVVTNSAQVGGGPLALPQRPGSGPINTTLGAAPSAAQSTGQNLSFSAGSPLFPPPAPEPAPPGPPDFSRISEGPTAQAHAAVRGAQSQVARTNARQVVPLRETPTPPPLPDETNADESMDAVLGGGSTPGAARARPSGVTVVPEPRAPLPGQKPGYMASAPRDQLAGAAQRGTAGAADVMQQTGTPLVYAPRGAGIYSPNPLRLQEVGGYTPTLKLPGDAEAPHTGTEGPANEPQVTPPVSKPKPRPRTNGKVNASKTPATPNSGPS